MEATLKRRMRKVVGYHVFFTIYLLLLTLFVRHPMVVNPSDPADWFGLLERPLWILLQPLPFAFACISGHQSPVFELLCFVLMPLWSLCFGWIFVQIDNWLNHFSVLGRKVF